MSADQQFTPEDARQLVRDAVERGLDAAYERVRTNRSHNLTPWPQRNLANDTEPEVLYEELVPGVQDRQTALVVEQIGDEYQVYSQEMLQERPGTYLPGKTGDVAQFVTLAEADAYFAQLKEELTGTPHPAGGVVAPQELGLYTLPSIEGAGITTSEARQLNEAAAEAMSEHRPQADQLPSHRQGKFWDVVVEIDDYEHVRMIRDGVLRQSPGSWSTRVDFDELGARGHRTVSDYLAADRSYPEQIDHALDYVQRGAADGADPSDVAHIGRAAIGLDKAMLAADYDGDPQGPVTPGEWMSLYEELDNQAQRASVQQQAALEQMTQQMPSQPGPDIR